MPKFIFNKLVRDKLRAEYEKMNQKAVYRELSPSEHTEQLKNKIIEEAREISAESSKDEIVSELADIQQVIDDIAQVHGISPDLVQETKLKKYEKKGGFSEATFVETLELTDDDDEWVEYYRKSPNIFKEIK